MSRAAFLQTLGAMVFVLTVAALGGCSPYALKGRVVTGDFSYIAVVDANDPRLDGTGIPSAHVELWTDPEHIRRKRVGSTVSDGDGWFSIKVDEFGAGVLEYDVGLFAQREGFARAQQAFRLPSQRQRILVVLRRGADTPGTGFEREDLMDEYRRFNR